MLESCCALEMGLAVAVAAAALKSTLNRSTISAATVTDYRPMALKETSKPTQKQNILI